MLRALKGGGYITYKKMEALGLTDADVQDKTLVQVLSGTQTTLFDKKPASSKFYTQLPQGFVEITAKPVALEFHGKPFDAAIYKPDPKNSSYKWDIIEQYTGKRLAGGDTQKDAIAKANASLQITEKNYTADSFAKAYFSESKISPRYKE